MSWCRRPGRSADGRRPLNSSSEPADPMPDRVRAAGAVVIVGYVVRVVPVEDTLQRIEVPLRRGPHFHRSRACQNPPGFFDHRGRQLLQGHERPHCVQLNLGCALQVLEPVRGLGNCLADSGDAVICHQDSLVADDPGLPGPGMPKRASPYCAASMISQALVL
jgi:hypothetical protein